MFTERCRYSKGPTSLMFDMEFIMLPVSYNKYLHCSFYVKAQESTRVKFCMEKLYNDNPVIDVT